MSGHKDAFYIRISTFVCETNPLLLMVMANVGKVEWLEKGHHVLHTKYLSLTYYLRIKDPLARNYK